MLDILIKLCSKITLYGISVKGSPDGAIKIMLAVCYKRLAPTGQGEGTFEISRHLDVILDKLIYLFLKNDIQ